MSDNREDLRAVATPALVLQCSDDVIAPVEVGAFVTRELRDAEMVMLDATGHCPNLSAPEATVAAIRAFVTA
jgi:sigma-B regulation protein RsbQ